MSERIRGFDYESASQIHRIDVRLRQAVPSQQDAGSTWFRANPRRRVSAGWKGRTENAALAACTGGRGCPGEAFPSDAMS